MGEKKKITVFRVFQAAQCGSAKYVLGVLCSAVSILCTAVPFYTVYRIVRIFLEASLHQAVVDPSQAWFWVGMTLASIAAGILLSVAGSVICHDCAFRALYDLRMRILGHMGKLNLGFFAGGQSGAVQKTMSDNIEKMEGIMLNRPLYHNLMKHDEYRLYFDDFNTGSTDPVVQEVLKGVVDSGLRYSSYSGCSVAVGNGEAIVYGHDTTYSINSKNPAQGHNKPVLSYSDLYDSESAVVQKGDVVAMATEPVGEGRVFLSGTVFCSNFEVAAEDQVSYSNGIIAQNILNMVKKEPVISTIEEARAGTDGQVFTVVGTVANGTAETGNAFFNTIYIQDDAGNGINVFLIDDNNIRRGDQVMITGSISEYIGDKQLSAINVTVLEGSKEVIISDATTKEADDYEANFGKLVRVEGVVQSVKLANGIVESIELQDESGQSCRVFIDGYIDYSDDASPELEGFVKEGATISAVGFVSHDAEGNRLRVRDRSEIKAEEQSPVSESYDVIFALTNGAADGVLKAEGGKDYAATLKPADGYALPETVKVIVGDAELPSEGYSYNAVTGELMIYGAYITGDIQILAEFIKEPSEEPGDTEQPGDTETPDDTEKPGESENPDGETPSEVPETGDAANIAVWLLVFAASGILVILTLFKRKGTAK